MTEDELRALVREAVARHVVPVADVDDRRGWIREDAGPRAHASHGLLPLARGSDGEGACLIEPAVRCNHCGYCLSYGH
jgi:hypothetical protein